jgi:hypothetical protein
MSLETEIRDLAYSKWEAAGCPVTTMEERNRFWYEAEQQVLSQYNYFAQGADPKVIKLDLDAVDDVTMIEVTKSY